MTDITWVKLAGSEPPEGVPLLLSYRGEIFFGEWDGEAFRDAFTGAPEPVDHWAIVEGP
jgi:broad specificity phosphatase PhoE